MASPFRFVAPAGTPIGFADLAWWARHALTDRDPVGQFSADIRARLGVRHCAFVSTGRAALTVALQALKTLDAKGRDEVVIPSYTCFSVASSVVKAGLKIRLADVHPSTLDFDSDALNRLDTSRVLAIVATNLYGMPNDLPALVRFAADRNVFVVDDAAQSLGATVGGRPSGTWGDVGIYSLDKGKNITSIDGGVIVTNNDAVADALNTHTRGLPQPSLGDRVDHIVKLLAYATLLHPTRYWLPNALPFLNLGVTMYRTDYPLAQYDPMLAVLGRRMLNRLDAVNAVRVDHARRLRENLPWSTCLEPVSSATQASPVYLRFPILVDAGRRDQMVAALRAVGIGATASYPTAIADIPDVRPELRGDDRDAVGGRDIAKRIVTLPTHPYVTAEDLDHMAEVVASVLARGEAITVGEHEPVWDGPAGTHP
jgi:dTDP-4-amino-4,6-dideoxygalactose transaminase